MLELNLLKGVMDRPGCEVAWLKMSGDGGRKQTPSGTFELIDLNACSVGVALLALRVSHPPLNPGLHRPAHPQCHSGCCPEVVRVALVKTVDRLQRRYRRGSRQSHCPSATR